MIRLQKYMSDCGIASRRACEDMIASGRVSVNGRTATVGMSVDPETDKVELDHRQIARPQKHVAIILYKPRGYVCTSSDEKGRKTVQDLVQDIPYRLYNVGRLDLNSEGLLIMTNNGDLANRLMHPRYHVSKTYRVIIDGKISAQDIAQLSSGVELEDGMTAPAKVTNIRPASTGGTALSITIYEGRNRQIRRMMEAVGHKTLRLKREAYGPLQLGKMTAGQWRYLTDAEIAALEAQAGNR